MSTSAPPLGSVGVTASPLPHTSTHRRRRVVGNWQLTRVLGQGSFTDVYLAKPKDCQTGWPADYAVKVLRENAAQRDLAVEMLKREVEVTQEVSHRHLVAILDSQLNEAPYFLVMPRLKAVSIRDVVEQVGRLSVRQTLWVLRQTCEALAALHQRNWLHGDVKPDNIMLSAGGHVTLIDLGFSLRRNEAMLTEARSIAGTLNYIAPEVLTSAHRSDQRSDIYSLGITMYQMLTGRLPFGGDNAAALIEAHRERPLPDPRLVDSGIPAELVRLLSHMTAKQPLRRPQSVTELINRLIPLEVDALRGGGVDQATLDLANSGR